MNFKTGYAFTLLLSIFIVSSCNWRRGGSHDDRVIAQVSGENLHYSQISPIVESARGTSDSALLVNKFIEEWVKRKLMIQKALLYLPDAEYNIDKQVRDYRESLLLYHYEKQLILEKLDTTVEENVLRDYYENYKNNFELTEDIVQLQYIKLPSGFTDIDSLMIWFSSDKEEVRLKVEDYCNRYASDFSLSDSVWVSVSSVYQHIPVREEQFSSFSRSKKPAIVTDPLFTHVMKVNELKSKGQTSPYHYVKDDITRIILNKRKVELVRKTYDNIYLEALKDKSFKILNE